MLTFYSCHHDTSNLAIDLGIGFMVNICNVHAILRKVLVSFYIRNDTNDFAQK